MADFNPEKTGPLYNQHHDRWQLETDCAEMTLDVLKAGTYLPKFSDKENSDDYQYRKDMSVPLDMCRDGVRIRVDNIWRTPPKREVEGDKYAELINGLIDNADGDGTTLDDFMRRAVWNYYVTGVDMVSQMAAPPEGMEIITKADAANLRPYFMQFTPLERPDWAAGGTRNFIWARYALGEVPPPDELYDSDFTVTKFLTLSQIGYRLWRVTRRKGSAEPTVTLIREGSHELGQPPVVKFYFAESQKTGQGCVPLALLTRPAIVAKVAMNLKSQADGELLAAVPRWFATGIKADNAPDVYGANTVWSAADPEAKLSVIQGLPAHIVEKREWLKLYLGEILRLLKFRGGMAEINATSGSGLKLAIERTDLDNELRATAAQCERVELEMMRQAVSLATGKEIPAKDAGKTLGYAVRYNRDFVLEPVAEMLANLKIWFRECGFVSDEVPEIGRELLRQLANAMVREDSDAYKQIEQEIDQASMVGVANPEEEGQDEDDEELKPPGA